MNVSVLSLADWASRHSALKLRQLVRVPTTRSSVVMPHLLRNLEAIVELEKAPDGWAAAMQTLLLEARDTAVHRAALLTPVLDHYESLPPPACGPAGVTAATIWPWPCGRCGTPVCSS